MEFIKEKSILIIAPSLIAESLSLKLTSLDKNLNITLNNSTEIPDLIIWNVLNYQSEDLLRLELLKLRQRFIESKIIVIFSGQTLEDNFILPNLSSEGTLLNPTAEKVLDSIKTILNGGRVFDVGDSVTINKKKSQKLSFNQKILSSGIKQIDYEVNRIFQHVNNELTPNFYKFILRGRLRELITAKSLLIFLWGSSLDTYNDELFINRFNNFANNDNTVFIAKNDSLEIWDLIYKRSINKYSDIDLDSEVINSSIILSGLKKEFISKIICNVLTELDNLIKNIKDNITEDYLENISSLISELRRNALANIAESYLRVKKNGESISLNEFIFNEFQNAEIDTESHDLITFIDPIIKNIPLNYDGKLLPLYETESFKIFEDILSNWVIRTCNLLSSEIFNYCSEWPELRSYLINSEHQSTRNFERFRNNINNYNRWHNNIYMPIYLYESKREYIDIIDNKFVRYFKSENREQDLSSLDWFQKQVTLLVEIRDAVAPQLEIALKYIGNIFVTILTRIVGKSIGLIGKGILQGLGRSNSK